MVFGTNTNLKLPKTSYISAFSIFPKYLNDEFEKSIARIYLDSKAYLKVKIFVSENPIKSFNLATDNSFHPKKL